MEPRTAAAARSIGGLPGGPVIGSALAGLVLAGGLLSGCGGDEPSAAPSPSTPSSAPGASVSPGVSASAGPTGRVPEARGRLVTYGRQGGLAGVNDRLEVRADGAYTITRRGGVTRRGRLAAAELRRLRAVLERSKFADIPSVNNGGVMADGFTYLVEHEEHTVLAEDGGVPDALGPVIGELDRLLDRHG